MKKISILIFAVFFMLMGNALATPIADVLDPPDGYDWINAPYWTLTDHTTGQNGSTDNTLIFEEAKYESDFGIFSFNDPTNMFQIFEASDKPGSGHLGSDPSKSVYFQEVGGTTQVSLDEVNWTDFDSTFGFYFKVFDPENYLHTFYTDPSLNTDDAGIGHIGMAWDGTDNAYFHLEDLRANSSDWDWDDMVVDVHDVAPVPEPGTILLLGFGLVGLGVAGRKRLKN